MQQLAFAKLRPLSYCCLLRQTLQNEDTWEFVVQMSENTGKVPVPAELRSPLCAAPSASQYMRHVAYQIPAKLDGQP